MLVERMIRAARLDVSLYEEVEADLSATSQAAIVVGIVAVANFVALLIVFAALNQTLPPAARIGIGSVIVQGLIYPFIAWIIWAYVTYFVGTNLFKGIATPGELLRTMGFAQSPRVLGILLFIPILGGIIAFIAFIWSIVTGVVAIRQALDITTGQAIVTAIISAIIIFIVFIILSLIGLGGVAP